MELGGRRPIGQILAELGEGRRRLAGLFGDRSIPVMVPPWNRVASELLEGLRDSGFTGISTFKPRRSREPVAGLRQVNCHVDPIDWHGGRRFRGLDCVIDDLVEHLAARRRGDVDEAEATGILSHHRVHDSACRRFLESLLEHTLEHPAAEWVGPATLFEPA